MSNNIDMTSGKLAEWQGCHFLEADELGRDRLAKVRSLIQDRE